VPPQVTPIDARLPDLLDVVVSPPDELRVRLGQPGEGATQDDWQAYWRRREVFEGQMVRSRIDSLEQLLRAALIPDVRTLATRARLVEERLPAGEDVGRLAWGSEALARRELVRRAALLLREAQRGPEGPRLVARLAGAARTELCTRRVPGSRWANATGCGSTVEYEAGEKDQNGLYACGSGHVPEASRRFLDFLQADGRWGEPW
jgi:hypothetical protein